MAQTGLRTCLYCASELRPGARFCIECSKFQSWRDRLAGTFSLSALVALVPTVALAAAFLNQTIVYPYSRVQAAVSMCTRDGAVLALSNTGTRKAIVDGGTVAASAFQGVRLALRPGTDRMTPIVLAPGDNLVARFAFADPDDVDRAQLMPIAPGGTFCRYQLTLSALEFGGKRRTVDAGSCACRG